MQTQIKLSEDQVKQLKLRYPNIDLNILLSQWVDEKIADWDDNLRCVLQVNQNGINAVDHEINEIREKLKIYPNSTKLIDRIRYLNNYRFELVDRRKELNDRVV